MKRFELEQRYEEYGRKDYQLRTLDDLKSIHGFDVTELPGYDGLPQEQRELFNKTIIKFYNAQGLDNRARLQPKNVNYVYEINYTYDNEAVGTDVYAVKNDGKTVGKRLHRHKFNKSADFRLCKEYGQKRYLRFELKGVWYHFMPNGEWY